VARKKLETLTEQMYYVLLALWEEPRHGYGAMQFIEARTGGRVSIGAGTLYALLSRFETEGLIRRTHEAEGRKYYLLTDTGRRVLTEEHLRLKRQVEDGRPLLERTTEGGSV